VTDPQSADLKPRFFATIGLLPGWWAIVAVTVAAGFGEGIGIALFVPLLQLMSGGEGEPGRLFAAIRDAFALAHVPFNLFTMLVAVTVLVLGALALLYLQRRIVFVAKNRYVRDLRDDCARRMLEASWPYLARQATGETINRMSVEANRAGLGLMCQALFVAAAIQVAILAAFSAALSWQLVIVAGAFALAIVLASRPLVRRAGRLGGQSVAANRDFAFHVVDFFRGAKFIKVTATEEPVLRRIAAYNNALYRVTRGYELNSALTNFLLQATPVAMLAAIIGVAYEAVGLPVAQILVFLLLLARIAPRVSEMQQRYEDYRFNIPGLGVVQELQRECLENAESRHWGNRPLRRLERDIVLDRLRFRYDDGKGAGLDGVSFRIAKNEIVAGVHRGYEGRILVDGVELRELDLAAWRRRIGYATQDVILFNDTLRNNLLFARPDATAAEVAEALRLAHLTDLVASLPKGLDTELAEGGARFSGGQRQRIALARTLIAKPDLLFLDEATSALDSESERIIQTAIESIAHSMTIVVIAHRLSTVRKADVIHVLEDGRVVESGTFGELMAKRGRFAALHEFQVA